MTPEEESKLASFKEITQYEDSDHDKMITLLTKCDWNLEAAIQRFFEGNFDFPEPESPREEPLFTAPRANTQPLDDYTLSQYDLLPKFPKANKLSGNWRLTPGLKKQEPQILPLMFIVMLIPRSIFFLIFRLGLLLRLLFPGLFAMFEPSPNALPAEPKNLTEAPKSLKTLIEETTRDQCDLPFFEGHFNDAYDVCKADLKFLLIILVNSENPDTELFIKHVLCSPRFREMIFGEYAGSRDNFMIWGGDVAYMEGWAVGKRYGVKNVPYMAMVLNVSTYGETFPTMLLMRFAQNFTVEGLQSQKVTILKGRMKNVVKQMKRAADQYMIQLVDQKLDRESQEFERKMKQQQDEAYLRSLEKDKEKKKERELEKERELKEKQEVLDGLVYLENTVEQVKRGLCTFESDYEGDGVTIQFRLPSGERFVKKFSRECTLKQLYMFIEVKLALKELVDAGIFESDQEAIEWAKNNKSEGGFEIEHRFELNLVFPKATVRPETKTISEEKCLTPKGNLLVEYDEDYLEQAEFLVENFKKGPRFKDMSVDDIELE